MVREDESVGQRKCINKEELDWTLLGCCLELYRIIGGAVRGSQELWLCRKKINHWCRLKKWLAGKTNFSLETRFANRPGEEDGDDVTWLAGDCCSLAKWPR